MVIPSGKLQNKRRVRYLQQSRLGKRSIVVIKRREQYLKQVCPTYDGSVTKNDLYRLQKALSYAIASEGMTFKRERTEYQSLSGNLPEDGHRYEFEAPFNELYVLLVFHS